ncbi:ATP-binding protein [uncultured Bacteroides sp.]|uniref:ATP-binding protein n=1 Tax=uncultured Bacteroides sp. TaxID=162156 RepID=UPI0025946A41|nr:ATP-binding protein [uncultured Bacteroides sp.]
MNERLIIKSFGPVKDLDITFKKVTLFIGDQGTGKSCVAKLFSMFKWLEKVLTQKKYKLNYFEQYNRFLTMLCSYHRIESFVQNESYLKFESKLYVFVYSEGSFKISDKNVEVDGLSKIMYVPAERSIVSVAENKTKLLKELPDSSETFSDEFVNAKKYFKSGYELPFEGLRFEYDSLNEVGWISGTGYKVRLINASSGIQSSLPMCMVSEYLSQMIADREEIKLSKEEKDKLEKRVADIMQNDAISDSIKDMMIRQLSSANRYDCFINIVEEPELNLFPKSQMEVLRSLVAINASSDKNMLILTSHSPYSLAILNMLIMGSKVYERAGEDVKATVENILPHVYHLHENEVAAYRLSYKDEKYCESVLNTNTGMIAKNDLDSCSDEINRTFNQLYRLYANTFAK